MLNHMCNLTLYSHFILAGKLLSSSNNMNSNSHCSVTFLKLPHQNNSPIAHTKKCNCNSCERLDDQDWECWCTKEFQGSVITARLALKAHICGLVGHQSPRRPYGRLRVGLVLFFCKPVCLSAFSARMKFVVK